MQTLQSDGPVRNSVREAGFTRFDDSRGSAALAALAALAGLAACSGTGGTETFYVLVLPRAGEQYFRDMIDVVVERGIAANPAVADDNRGNTRFVIEGLGRGVRVWSVNVPLTGPEAAACGEPQSSRIDSTQFVVTVSSRNPFKGEAVPAVTREVISSLEAKGYVVRAEPRLCGSP